MFKKWNFGRTVRIDHTWCSWIWQVPDLSYEWQNRQIRSQPGWLNHSIYYILVLSFSEPHFTNPSHTFFNAFTCSMKEKWRNHLLSSSLLRHLFFPFFCHQFLPSHTFVFNFHFLLTVFWVEGSVNWLTLWLHRTLKHL